MKARTLLTRLGLAGSVVLLGAAVETAAQHPLDSWARRTVPGLTTNLSSVAFGNGVFVAVGAGSTVATSPDGANWTVSNAGAYGNLVRVRFINGQFIAVGASDKILLSADGASWTANTLPTANSWDVAYGNGVYVVAGATTYVSSDGVTWAMSRGPLDSVAFGNGRFAALPTGMSFSGTTYYSSNGVNWLPGGSTTPANNGRGEVIFAGGKFLAEAAQWDGVFTSSDGASWCCGFNGTGGSTVVEGGGLAYGQGYFVHSPIGSFVRPVPYIYSSTNGTAWVNRLAPNVNPSLDNPALVGRARGAAFGNDSFVFVGDGGYIIQSGSLGGTPLILQEPQDRGAVAMNPSPSACRLSAARP